ncbi:MAG TPA: phosphoribosylanthranilate isomerase [Steroidobacteraceae bacterium]|nr:phosphoribosylanthranilate isomerase [Steroidobacteraceae bacterium]
MWIKVCGMTTAAAVDAAVASGVDAIGFVFASSVRELTPTAAAALALPARGRLRCVAVTRHPTQAEVDEIVRVFSPDILQSDAEDFAGLRLPSSLERLPVIREEAALPAPLPTRVLYEGPVSGRGRTVDWSLAAALADHTELVLAGGLNPANVAAAIAAVHPFGVDVSSGVEQQSGVKSPAAIVSFAAAVRAAAALPPRR